MLLSTIYYIYIVSAFAYKLYYVTNILFALVSLSLCLVSLCSYYFSFYGQYLINVDDSNKL